MKTWQKVVTIPAAGVCSSTLTALHGKWVGMLVGLPPDPQILWGFAVSAAVLAMVVAAVWIAELKP